MTDTAKMDEGKEACKHEWLTTHSEALGYGCMAYILECKVCGERYRLNVSGGD